MKLSRNSDECVGDWRGVEDVIDSSLSFLTKNQRQVSTISDDENSYVKCLAVVLTSRQLPLLSEASQRRTS